ncbi:hypothetical protein SRHO_G00039150 [Serrasalmus rhombeus]
MEEQRAEGPPLREGEKKACRTTSRARHCSLTRSGRSEGSVVLLTQVHSGQKGDFPEATYVLSSAVLEQKSSLLDKRDPNSPATHSVLFSTQIKSAH